MRLLSNNLAASFPVPSDQAVCQRFFACPCATSLIALFGEGLGLTEQCWEFEVEIFFYLHLVYELFAMMISSPVEITSLI